MEKKILTNVGSRKHPGLALNTTERVLTNPAHKHQQGLQTISVHFFNAQSLTGKIDTVSLYLEEQKPDIIGVAETWMDGSHCEGDIKMNNYRVEMK